MRVAIHQPAFCPWFPFFYKMAMVDTFVLLTHVQFEKNGWQNRCNVWDKWWTKPVQHGKELIYKKKYTDDRLITSVNYQWIYAIKETLNINTHIESDHASVWLSDRTPTEKLIAEVKLQGGDTYVTNPSAKDKYLDEDLMKQHGIKIEYCVVPKNLQRHTFEVFNEFGIVGAMKQLPRGKCEKP